MHVRAASSARGGSSTARSRLMSASTPASTVTSASRSWSSSKRSQLARISKRSRATSIS